MFDTIFNVPVHPLIVHAVVVLVPTAALLIPAAALWPRFRAWAGPLPALAGLAALVLTPLATKSGEKLQGRVDPHHFSTLILDHRHLGETLKWYVLPLAVIGVVGYLLHRRGEVRKAVVATVAVLAVLVSIGTVVDVVRIGHSGARAVYAGYVH